MKIIALLTLACALTCRLAADTPTFTATLTATTTQTPTGAGEGSYTTNPASVVNGSPSNYMKLDYTVGSVPFTTGLIAITAPNGFDPFTPDNFELVRNQAVSYSLVAVYPTPGQTPVYSAQLSNVPAGTVLEFLYGSNTVAPFGFTVTTGVTETAFTLSSVPYSTDPGNLLPVTVQPTIVVLQATPTATPTTSPTPSPTVSPTFTVSMTWTESPVPPINPTGAYSYPNPFDMRQFDKVTFRFPADTGVVIDIYNLAGVGVAHFRPDPGNILTPPGVGTAAGWAIWDGRDGHGRRVSGGLYFYRISGDKNKWTGKMTVVH